MKCSWKFCKNAHLEEFEIYNKHKYHCRCKEDMLHLTKIGELYLKYYNPSESWAIMNRSLYNWYHTLDAEYMLFVISKLIREKVSLFNFFSLRTKFGESRYMNEFKEYKSGYIKQYEVFDKVHMLKEEYANLLEHMNGSTYSLNYYINQLNEYMNNTGKTYANHAETIKSWYDKAQLSKIAHREEDYVNE